MTTVIVVPTLTTTSAGIAIAPVSAAVDAVSLLATRSPGIRAEGALSTKKMRMLPLADADGLTGTQVLANLPPAANTPMAPLPAAVALPPDVAPAGEAMMPPPAFAQVPYVALADGPPSGAVPTGSNGGNGVPVSPVFPGPPAGGGGGGGGGIIVVPTPTPTPTPVSPIPEPAAWALMLTAFPLVGAMLRRRNRSAAVA